MTVNMRWIKWLTMGCLMAVLSWPVSSSAVGLGVYVGESRVEYDTDFDSIDADIRSFGFVLDSAVAADRVFNYRLELGYGRSEYDLPLDMTIKTDVYTINNTFGFGVVRTRVVRLWLGPQLGIYYEDGDGFWDAFGINVGPALGLNIHLGPVVSLSFSAYGRYGYYYIDFDDGDYDDTQWIVGGHAALLFRLGGDRY